MMIPLKSGLRTPAALLAALAVLFVAGSAAAQRGDPFGHGFAALPPASRPTVQRLMSLNQLPEGTWLMHAGDVAHGEDVNLDESGWQPIAVGAKAPNEAVWFRQTVRVPQTLNGYDLSGARIWFQFQADANGPMPEIFYFNGRRVAIGEDLEPVVLFDKAQPGEQAVIAVKLLHTVDVKTFHGAMLRIDFPPGRPNPVDLAEEFLSAALLAPSFAPGNAADMTTIEDAVAAVDTGALDESESAQQRPGQAVAQAQAKFDASLEAAKSRFEPLKPMLQQASYLLDGNAHIDAAWLWPWTESVGVVKDTFSTALQLMYEYPGYTFTQSAAAYNEWMARDYPDINAQIKQRIKQGQWEVVGGMWVEPDLNLPDGESLVRQLLVGKRWYEQNYGVDVRVGWNPDSFGYSWQLPQIYKKSGVDYFVTQKMSWNDTNKLPFKLFWWKSPDGSKVLTYFPDDYANLTLNPVRLANDLRIARQYSPGMTEMMDLYGVGDHGGGPTRAILDEGFHWAGLDPKTGGPITPKYEFGTALSFFTTVEKQVAPESRTWNYQSIAKGYETPSPVPDKVAIPTWDSELYLEFHRGVYTTQAAHKHNMRAAEEEMLNTEKWASLAWLDGAGYPDDRLTEDWKKVLFNQFHDLAAGSGIPVIYKDAQRDYDWVRMSTDEISADALQTVAEHVDTSAMAEKTAPGEEAFPVVVFNPLGWQRSGDVTVKVQSPGPGAATSFRVLDDADGKFLPFAVQSSDASTGVAELRVHVTAPALGYKLLTVVSPSTRALDVTFPATLAGENAGAITLENSHLRVQVDKESGCITSLDVGGVDTLAAGACGNQFQFFKDLPKEYDAWNIDPGTLDVPPATIAKADSVELVDGKTRHPTIRITRHWQNSKFVQTIDLAPQSDIVDIGNDIDWHESHVLLKAAFPLAVTSNFATYEIPYGTIERATTRNNSWEKAQFEVPALRWADLSGKGPNGAVYGVSVLNKDKYGYDAAGNVLRLTLLRSPKWPDPNADMGQQRFHYAIYPHAGTWKQALTMRHGWEYDYPLEAVVTTAHPGTLPAAHSFASVGPDNVVLTAVKKAEDADALIFRAYEWAGRDSIAEFHVPAGATGATVTNLMEKPEGSPLTIDSGVIKTPIHPYEILTVRVDYRKQGAANGGE